MTTDMMPVQRELKTVAEVKYAIDRVDRLRGSMRRRLQQIEEQREEASLAAWLGDTTAIPKLDELSSTEAEVKKWLKNSTSLINALTAQIPAVEKRERERELANAADPFWGVSS